MESFEHYFETNRASWNTRTHIHQSSAMYDLEGFRSGKTSLQKIELEELKEVEGKTMLHLQCHFGLDTISWGRKGTKVVGIDFSEDAISLAKELLEAEDVDGRFICSNVYDLRAHLEDKFDIVYTSYGTITWLPDLDRWASIVSHFLKPGGRFYMAEFHPVMWMLDDEMVKLQYPYFNTGPMEFEESDYTDLKGDHGKTKNYCWNHPVSDILNSLIRKGLKLEYFHEFDFSPYDCFPHAVEVEPRKWQIQDYEGKMPLVYSILMTK